SLLRHGMHVYKPLNDITCCPAHPIWCDTMRFRISNAHRRTVSVLEAYLRNDLLPKRFPFEIPDPKEAAELRKPGENEDQTQRQMHRRPEAGKENGCVAGTKVRPEQAAGLSLTKIHKWNQQPKIEWKKSKELEEYMKRVEKKEKDMHTLEVRMYSCSPLSPELSATLRDEHEMLNRCFSCIYTSSPDSISLEEFQETYVETPLVGIHDEKVEAADAPKFGTYHQQYWLDGAKLIAVSVVDLLPDCLSSVYFFNDPRYSILRLDIFSALWEIAYVRNLQRIYGETVPAYANLRYYTRGYYVHRPSKMNYNGLYLPSYLTCPLTYTWVSLGRCKRRLDKNKYSRLSQAAVGDPLPIPPDEEVTVQLPFSENLISLLLEGSYTLEDDAVVTTLAVAKDVLYKSDLKLIDQWIYLVRNTRNMRIVCRNWVGML
ncbi:Arginyl-tRNA--protein transferase 1, partial [Taenia solium]